MNLLWLAQTDLVRSRALEAENIEQSTLVLSVYAALIVLGLVVDSFLVARFRRETLNWRESLSRLYWRPLGSAELRLVLVVLTVVFCFSLLLRPVLGRLADATGWTVNTFLVIVQSILFHWIGLAVVVWVLFRRKLPWRSAFGFRAKTFLHNVGQGVLLLLATMPLLVGTAFVYNMFLRLFGVETTLQDVAYIISGETSPWLKVYFFVLAVILAPLFEEILFRGMLLPVLAKRFGATASVIAVSLLFAGIHGHVPSLVPLFVLSSALCLAYIGTGSLMTSIAMHALFNSVTVTLLFALR